ncbi:S-layer homology domain-containing protein [Aneurinibacillus danicus]|jgi:hypothetical protein|uniref:SLH domain-containing protein n=1 Tax=Aneurinibacillus danicus TaxID=267746 RepID=A0A511V952_9BACL|nr:S-layer homology domain-containing protein [Aneurinibacillus danicus]GEN35455.1 hypothetical protein ADA01nite_29150 [Aneurinibacillus danicus]
MKKRVLLTGLLAVSLASSGAVPGLPQVIGIEVAEAANVTANAITSLRTGEETTITLPSSQPTYNRIIWNTDPRNVASGSDYKIYGKKPGSTTLTGTAYPLATSTTGDTIRVDVTVLSNGGTVRDFMFNRITYTGAEFSWLGTTGPVYVEVKPTNGGTSPYSGVVSSRSLYVSNLSPNTEYEVFIDNQSIVKFTTNDNYGDRYYYDGRWYYYDDYYDDRYSDSYVRDFRIDGKSDTHVDISWRGTSRNVYVELRKRSSGSNVSSKWANENTSFSGLSPDTEYSIYIDGRYMASFTTEKNRAAYNVVITKNTSNRSVDVSWSGTNGTVEAVLKKNGSQVDSKRTSEKKTTFYNLERGTEYYLYIDGKYIETFSLPSESTLPSQTTWQPPSSTWQPPVATWNPVTFTDVNNHWAKSAVERLASYGVVRGFAGGLFKPEKLMTREEFIVMLVNAQKYEIGSGTTGFSDVQTERWSAPYIAAAVQNGIITSSDYSGDRFLPGKFITREEAAVMIARALKLTPDASALTFTDTSSIQNKEMVGAAVKGGIITGEPDNTFKPRALLIRGAAAVMINAIYKPY